MICAKSLLRISLVVHGRYDDEYLCNTADGTLDDHRKRRLPSIYPPLLPYGASN